MFFRKGPPPVPSRFLLVSALFSSAVLFSSCGQPPDPGAAAISRYGCGSCHTIPGISGAVGIAGPPLAGIGNRFYLAGVMQNTRPNMIRWIENPKAVDEKTLMPNLGVTHRDAADIAAYLYTLK